MDKVLVSVAVAEALSKLTVDSTISEIFNWVTADYEISDKNIRTLKAWHLENDDEGEKLMQLLIGQYEVEETPEEQLLVVYKQSEKNKITADNVSDAEYWRGFCDGVSDSLETLNIKIKGINEEA